VNLQLPHSYQPLFLICRHSNHRQSDFNFLIQIFSNLSVFNISHPTFSSTHSKPFSVFLDDFNSSLSATTTSHKFTITGNFKIHLDNPAGTLTSQFLSLLSISLNTCTFLPTTKTTFLIWSQPLPTPHLLRLFLSPTCLHPKTFLFSPNYYYYNPTPLPHLWREGKYHSASLNFVFFVLVDSDYQGQHDIYLWYISLIYIRYFPAQKYRIFSFFCNICYIYLKIQYIIKV